MTHPLEDKILKMRGKKSYGLIAKELGITRSTVAAMSDTVNHPQHYRSANGLEVIDVIEGFDLGFHEGNVVKYLLRWRQKGGIEDLRKAHWYLDRFIERETARGK